MLKTKNSVNNENIFFYPPMVLFKEKWETPIEINQCHKMIC